MSLVRTRFAPSPTGFLHVGGVRTALFAWLIAQQKSGQFILRIEDTDKTREVENSTQHIIQSLQWLGIDWDEGPDNGGPFGPYKQSERLAFYKEWAQKLVDANRAYVDPYSTEQVNKFRDQAKTEKRPFLFRDHRPVSQTQSWDGTKPLRFKSDPKSYHWHDEVLGDLSSGPEVVDDFILIKSDGYPTYNFAHVVDDHLMKISHVIRSQEFTASVPQFLNLYEALAIPAPLLATLPFVIRPDGKKKLSKRDNAKDILDYKKEGYLPDALLNFLATIGWNDGTKQEIFSRAELVKKFDLSKVQRSGAHFDEKRLLWMNGYYIRKLPIDKLLNLSEGFWPAEAADYNTPYKKQVLGLVQERLKYLAELETLTRFFFKDLPVDIDLISNHKQLKNIDRKILKKLLEDVKANLELSDFSLKDLTTTLNNLLVQTDQKPVVLFSLIRIATTQAPASPSLVETLAVLGKETTLRRINTMLTSL